MGLRMKTLIFWALTEKSVYGGVGGRGVHEKSIQRGLPKKGGLDSLKI